MTMPPSSAVVIPYYSKNGSVFVFLQMRDGNAREDKDVFSLFGGQMEPGEDPLAAIRREMREEFSHPPTLGEKLGIFKNFADRDMHVFLAPVPESFADETEVLEGRYGTFLTALEVRTRTDISHIVLPVVEALEKYLEIV